MNIGVKESEQEYFTVEDIVSYSNIEITHVNDNKAPVKVIVKRVAVLLFVLSLLVGIYFI